MKTISDFCLALVPLLFLLEAPRLRKWKPRTTYSQAIVCTHGDILSVSESNPSHGIGDFPYSSSYINKFKTINYQ